MHVLLASVPRWRRTGQPSFGAKLAAVATESRKHGGISVIGGKAQPRTARRGRLAFSMTLSHPGTESLTARIIGAAIEVHRHLGPGLLESTYEDCLCWEFGEAGIRFRRQPLLPMIYKGRRLGAFYRPDIVVESSVVVEVKSVGKLAGVHSAQVLTYLKHADIKVGLLFNFNSTALVNGMKRLSI